jgi:hypothetical protein
MFQGQAFLWGRQSRSDETGESMGVMAAVVVGDKVTGPAVTFSEHSIGQSSVAFVSEKS